MAHRDLGYKIINRLIEDLGDAGIVEFMPRMEGTICTPSSPPRARRPPHLRSPPPTPAAKPADAKPAVAAAPIPSSPTEQI